MTDPSDPNRELGRELDRELDHELGLELGHELDHELDRAIARLVDDAGADSPKAPDSSAFIRPGEPASSDPSGGRRLAMAGAIALIVGAVAGVTFVAARDDGGRITVRPVDSSPTDTGGATVATPSVAPTDTAGAIVATPSVAPNASSATASSETPTPSTTVDTLPAESGLTRPVTDSSTCDPVSARETFTEGLTLFARSSTNPVPIQVVANPVEGLVGPFAIVQRFFGDDRIPTGDEAVDIDGTTFWIRLADNGNGAVGWDVGDGSVGNVRSRGLDRTALIGLVSAFTPRPATVSIPGFNYRSSTGGLQLLHEQMNTDIDGEVGSSECVVASTGYGYRISAINGDPVFQYGGVIDRLVPLEVGTQGSTLIVIDGVSDPAAPTVKDVVDADREAWLELRSQPRRPEESEPRTESISEGADVVVALDSVDDSTAQSYLTLRLTTQQGVTFLEVDTANAVLAPDAAFWRTQVDPGTSGASTANVGGVLGFRIGDAPIGEPIEVTVSVIDGGEFVLQSTGTITLIPN